jgi:hypothetical protein
MSAVDDPGAELTPAEARDLRRLAAFMVPASAEHGVPGADDAAIFADIVRSLGRDRDAVREALASRLKEYIRGATTRAMPLRDLLGLLVAEDHELVAE